jgi:ssDNA-binding protein
MAQANSGNLLTPEARLSFADSLFEAKSMDGVKFTYGCTLIFDNKHKEFFEKIVRDVVLRKWGEKGVLAYERGAIKSPILDGNGPQAHSKESGELWPGFGEGTFFLRVNANHDARPYVCGHDRQVPAGKEEVYSGCWGKAVLNAYSWENPSGGRGVSFGIRAFQKFRDGESLGGRGPFDPTKWFVDIPDDATPGEDQVDIFS